VDGVSYIRSKTKVPAFAYDVLTARVRMDRRPAANTNDSFSQRFGTIENELIRRLRKTPGVHAATIGLPGPGPSGSTGVIEIEAVKRGDPLRVALSRVDEDFFEVFEMPLLSGRKFDAGEITLDSDAVIVSEGFAETIPGQVLGRRLRYLTETYEQRAAEYGRWYEIVGIVKDDGENVYHPALLGRVDPAYLAIDLGPDPAKYASDILKIAESVDPSLHLDQFISFDGVLRRTHLAEYWMAAAITAMTASVILLSAAGIHALMSAILSQRRREIGVRLALGARPLQLVKNIFSRATFGLVVGATGGTLLAILIRRIAPEELFGFHLPGVIPATAVLMILIGLIAAAGPVRRALRIDPNETLRDA
jgi:hypothetical protein